MRIFEGLQHTPIKRIDRQIQDFRYDKTEEGLDGEVVIKRGNEHHEIRWEAIFVSAAGLPEMKQLMITIDAEPPPTRAWNGITYRQIRYSTQELRVWYRRDE